MRSAVFIIWFGLLAVCQGAESEVKLRGDLKRSLEKLDGVRKMVNGEQIALSKKLVEVEKELIGLRRKTRLARMDASAREADFKSLRRKHAVLLKDKDYLEGILRDYAVATKLDALGGLDVISKGMDLLEEQLGGRRYAGDVVTSGGEVISGEIAELGSAVWFSGEGESGAVVFEEGNELGTVLSSDEEGLGDLFDGKESVMQVDVTGGKARIIAEVQGDSIGKLFVKGGVWLWPIIAVALISAICAILKMIQLMGIRRPRVGWLGEMLELLREGNRDGSVQVARGVKHPAGDLLGDAMGYIDAGAEVVEEVVYERLIGVQAHLQKWLSFIAVTAAIAPLLGLLGTVSGMIRMFNVITVTGTGDVKPMAGGISEALVTTLFGLVVAIPALILHAMLSRRSNGVVQETEKFGLSLVNGLRNMEKGK